MFLLVDLISWAKVNFVIIAADFRFAIEPILEIAARKNFRIFMGIQDLHKFSISRRKIERGFCPRDLRDGHRV